MLVKPVYFFKITKVFYNVFLHDTILVKDNLFVILPLHEIFS